MNNLSARSTKNILIFIIILFLGATLPLAFKRPTGGRSGERQGQTAGMIRIYCEDPSWNFVRAPQVHYGNQPFNLEFSMFEWMQGRIASAIDGPACDSVESLAKTVSILFSALALVFIFLIGSEIGGAIHGLLGAALLATNGLWMRYATYTMLDNRMICMALAAVYFTLKRRPIAAFAFWSLSIVQKPQAFIFHATFWFVLELTRGLKIDKAAKKMAAALAGSLVFAFAYYKWSAYVNAESDLPWIQWMGPRVRGWYFGDWHERIKWVFYKNWILDSLRRTGLNVALAALALFAFSPALRSKTAKSGLLRTLAIASLPFFVARLIYPFIFHNVFVVHEYYSLPLNAFASLSSGVVLGHLWSAFITGKEKNKTRFLVTPVVAVVLATLAVNAIQGIREYAEFAVNVDNPKDWRYQPEWNVNIFPERRALVAMAGSGTGRDILNLYFTKMHGYAWCTNNRRFAPRMWWKSQGVKYVGWITSFNRETMMPTWEVLTIDQEIAYAKAQGWEDDVWSGRSMSEWALLGSTKGYEPCTSEADYDPRKWKQ